MTDKNALNDAELDALFAAAHQDAIAPSDDLMARVMADALDAQPDAAPIATPDVPDRGLWVSILGAIGGWPAAAGLATATVAGVVIGVSTPDTLQDLAGLTGLSGYALEDLMPSYGGLLEEG